MSSTMPSDDGNSQRRHTPPPLSQEELAAFESLTAPLRMKKRHRDRLTPLTYPTPANAAGGAVTFLAGLVLLIMTFTWSLPLATLGYLTALVGGWVSLNATKPMLKARSERALHRSLIALNERIERNNRLS